MVPFDPNIVLGELPKVKKYTSEASPLPIESQTLPLESQSELSILEIRSSSRPMTPIGQVTITNGTMIMKFPVGNNTVIHNMIERLNTETPSLPTYRATIKGYIDYQAAIGLIRDLQMQKLREVAANKKKRSKQTVGWTVIDPDAWNAILAGEEDQRREKEAKANEITQKKQAAANKKAITEAKKKAKTAVKKNNRKGTKVTAIDADAEAIDLLFQDIDYGEPERVEAQLAAQLEATTLNEATIDQATSRSGRIRRAPVRFRNS